MNNVSNVMSPIDSTPSQVLINVKLARQSLIASRDSAARAAAHVYFVWREVASPLAHADMRMWFEEQVNSVNIAVDKHNTLEKALKTRVGHFQSGTLPKTDALMIEANSDADRVAIEADRAALLQLAKLTKSDWERRRKVRLDAGNEGISKFLLVAKFVLDLDTRSQASLASRYAKVMEWIDDRFNADHTASIDDIVNAIKTAGGFDEVLDISRGNDGNDANDDAKEREITNSALIEQAKDVVMTAVGKAEFKLDSLADREGIVTFIGRCVDGNVQVVGALDIVGEQFDRTLLNFNDTTLLPANPRAEFLSRVLRLGSLVRVGEKTDKKLNDLKAGPALKSERVLSFVQEGDGSTHVIVSSRYADASVVVVATPREGSIGLKAPTVPVMLDSPLLAQLTSDLAERASNRLIDIELPADDESAKLLVTNAALAAKGHSGGLKTFELGSMEDIAYKPLVVDGFRPQITGTVARPHLRRFYDDGLSEWESGDTKATQKVAQLRFSNGTLTYALSGQTDVTIPCALTTQGTDAINLRTRDLHDVVDALLAENISSVSFGADPGGMLRLSWTDHVGSYEVYLPTATSAGELSSRRLEPMRITATSLAA